ncbi:oxidoreductase [Thermomonospora cellulosilytica]|uniref:2,4-dienoyl-CoA reductase-like NADH-dependent reductase (Old Yellow Enzyme family) n=1 Tax=Thermomonospora cellulosilytica TaxID=1411118 RepID=A0A7W3MUC2_9ACTN|nr:NADH:flavin oxidoreductase [Thermomonospora cellulosilytica]MBA9001957.1 2,4-dienoyl-CoA reductase-like NADH-dependent reductase (Old Yellow Enzyme family) [Thermomonospora cellulosilytica]
MTAALEPGRIGGLDLPNRLVVAPMTRVSAMPDGTPTAEMADYYAEYAEGGFGLVITEGTYTDTAYSQGYLNQPGIVNERHVEGWREVTRRVHEAGGRIVLQLMHAGALSQGNRHTRETAGPSAVRPRGEMMPAYGGHGPWPVPREMSTVDIKEAVTGFVTAAANARQAGFDGVEVHGANGYLLDQFLTDYTNRREDSYGGPVANRIRLTAEVVAAIRAEVGADWTVGVRLSQTKVNDFEYRWPGRNHDAEIIFAALADAGASYLHIASEGRDWLETARLDGGVTVTGLARRVGGVPVIANGGMHDPDRAAQVLGDGHADFLSLGHGALANPDLPRRLAAGEPLVTFDREMLEPFVTIDNARRWRLMARDR